MDINKKTCSIALMSGKGGSGKTTLALSMASLLSSCNVKTLLVDCDISTNGATYFFEEEMAYYVNNIDTLHDLLEREKSFEDIHFYPVNKAFDFLPSVTKIGKAWTGIILDQEKESYLESLFAFISNKYEVVIYDCQAGYTEILETVIRMTDRNLMVLEADSVSASAVRNLFLKLNKVWDNKRIYQVFNKATKEEAEIYNKVTSGTMFDNIGCILFDWTVRRAFSVSKIPDMINTSAGYGMQVCDLCNSLIKNPDISQKLSSYTYAKRREELKSLEKDLNEKIKLTENKKFEEYESNRQKYYKRKKRLMYTTAPSLAVVIIYVLIMISPDTLSSIFSDRVFILAPMLLGLTLIIALPVWFNEFNKAFSTKIDDKYNEAILDIDLKSLQSSLLKVQTEIRKLEASDHSIDKGNKKTST